MSTPGEPPPALALPIIGWRDRLRINLSHRQHADHLLTSLLLAWVALSGPLEVSAQTSDIITVVMTLVRTSAMIMFFAEEGLL